MGLKNASHNMAYLGKKNNLCVFTVTCQKNLNFIFIIGKNLNFIFIIGKTGNSRSRFRNFIFEISGKMTNYAVFLPSLLSISTKS
jgi:hypothetical protein